MLPRSVHGAALALVLSGAATVDGSLRDWGACSKEPCEGAGGLFHLFWRTGVDLGPGVVTAVLGVALVFAGLFALLFRGAPLSWALPLVLASSQLLVLGAWVVRISLFPHYTVYITGIGFPLVVAGGLIALAASWRLRQVVRAGTPISAGDGSRLGDIAHAERAERPHSR